jgi:hypothetical protein
MISTFSMEDVAIILMMTFLMVVLQALVADKNVFRVKDGIVNFLSSILVLAVTQPLWHEQRFSLLIVSFLSLGGQYLVVFSITHRDEISKIMLEALIVQAEKWTGVKIDRSRFKIKDVNAKQPLEVPDTMQPIPPKDEKDEQHSTPPTDPPTV